MCEIYVDSNVKSNSSCLPFKNLLKINIHACDCYYSEGGCVEAELLHTKCNCDSNEPTVLLDTGLITSSTALPMLTIAFGGLRFDIQALSRYILTNF